MKHGKLLLMMIVVSAFAVSGGSGCKQDEPKTADETRESAAAERPSELLPANLFMAEAPKDAMSVAEAKADADASGEVVVRGRIGGRKEPFVDGAAVFLLADASMKACNELHGDGCKTPWDYCCEPRDSLAAKTATVQVVGEDGKPLRVGLEEEGGLEPLATVVVVGEIAKRGDSGVLVINARRIHVESAAG